MLTRQYRTQSPTHPRQIGDSHARLNVRSHMTNGKTDQSSQMSDARYDGTHGPKDWKGQNGGQPLAIERYLSEADGLDPLRRGDRKGCLRRGELMTSFINNWESKWKEISETRAIKRKSRLTRSLFPY